MSLNKTHADSACTRIAWTKSRSLELNYTGVTRGAMHSRNHHALLITSQLVIRQ